MKASFRLGEWGEAAACGFLQMCGYRCLAKRFRRGGGEIDLVMARGNRVVFVEVKTRGRNSPAVPEAWVDGRKLARMRRLARIWIHECPENRAHDYRFDVVAVEFDGEGRGYRVRHLPGVS